MNLLRTTRGAGALAIWLCAIGSCSALGACSLLVDTDGHEFRNGGSDNAIDGDEDAGDARDDGGAHGGTLRDASVDGGSDAATPVSCGEIDCGSERDCIEDPAGARCACKDGAGWDAQRKACVACDSVPDCTSAGETGALLVRGEADARCRCETRNGYFYSARTATTIACDADRDGWTNQEAVTAATAADPVERVNARCNARRVQAIVLQNEIGEEHSVDLSDEFPLGLPLYESARNDGANDANALPRYFLGDGRTIAAREVNSLTKACVSPGADFNDDGVPDVDEWSASELDPERYAGDADLVSASRKYVEFGYFFELHDGWYEAPAKKGAPAIYRIVEKTRVLDDADAVPLRFPDGAPDYVNRCVRHIDALYSGDSPNTIGGDFSVYGDDATMTHHSQFKCLRVVGESSYKQAFSTERDAPQRVYRKAGALVRLDGDGVEHSYGWTINDCYADEGSESPPSQAARVNPLFPHVHCAPVAEEPALDTVRWAAVGYEAYSEPYQSYFDKGGYQRGCIDQCLERLDRRPVIEDCMHCTTGTYGQGMMVPDEAGADCGGGQSCDGTGTCGDCVPERTSCAPTEDGARVCGADGSWQAPASCDGSALVCSDGACASCGGDLRDCNEQSSDGCETDSMNGFPDHCGGCGLACSTSHISRQCSAGTCGGGCDQGWDDCNDDKRSDGCEFDVSADFDHCGSCFGVCTTAHERCEGSACIACPPGTANCDRTPGCEVAIYDDWANCGSCGAVCNSNEYCSGGFCYAYDPGGGF